MVRVQKLHQLGNTVAVGIPAGMRRALKLHKGDTVMVALAGDVLVVRKIDEPKIRRDFAKSLELFARGGLEK